MGCYREGRGVAALQPAARKLQREMQIGGSAWLLGRAASGHSSMGLKSIYPTSSHPRQPPPPLSSGYVFFSPPPATIQEDGKKHKRLVLGLIPPAQKNGGVTGFSRCQCLYPYCCAFLQKNIMSRLKRVSVFWLRCKMYCHYCLFHSCLVVIENMQSNVGHVYPSGSLHTSVHTSNASRATTSKFMTGYGHIYYGGGEVVVLECVLGLD